MEEVSNFVPNSTLRLLCCVSAVTVYALLQVSPQEPSGPAAVHKNTVLLSLTRYILYCRDVASRQGLLVADWPTVALPR